MTKSILLVEDMDIIALSEIKLLLRAGYRVLRARTGEEALKFVEGGVLFDLVLMDIELGEGISGIEAASCILERRNVPVVFLTSHERFEVELMADKIRYAGYLYKSTTCDTIINTINKTIELFRDDYDGEETEVF